MSFDNLFISYKIGLKGIKNTIPFTKLPFYRKIFAIGFCGCGILSAICLILHKIRISCILMGIGILLLIVFWIIDSKKGNLEIMLNEYYIPYSEKRIRMTIEVLKKYKIDIHNFDSIDMLIEEAKIAQIKSDYIDPLKKPFKILSTIVIPIVVFAAQKIGTTVSTDEMIPLVVQSIYLILLIFALIFLLTPIIKGILYADYDKYDSLIHDLRQIKLFYSE